MTLERLCELLGFEIQVRRCLSANGGDPVFVGEATIRTNGWGNEFTARIMLQQHLERMVADIIAANRNLSDEDLNNIRNGVVQ